MNQEPQSPQELEALLAAGNAAKRAKLLQSIRTRFHWAEWLFAVLGVGWICLSFRSEDSLDRPLREAMLPASQLAIGFFWILLTFVAASTRRIDALVKLFEERETTR